jgi:uncharacterized membrane protein YcaP (DUF421 family)
MNDVVFWFGGWPPIGRILVVGTFMYVALVVLLRVSGSRTLASMNVFDFIVTVAIGAAFGRTLTTREVALAEALAAFALLVSLQFAVAWAQTRWTQFMGIVTNPPSLLYFRGEFLRKAMRQQRVTEALLRAAVRKEHVGSMNEVEAIVLESSGEFSVIRSVGDGSALGQAIQEQIARLVDDASHDSSS